MDKTRTIGKKRPVNELDLYFDTLRKYAKAESNPIIFSNVIVPTNHYHNYTLKTSVLLLHVKYDSNFLSI